MVCTNTAVGSDAERKAAPGYNIHAMSANFLFKDASARAIHWGPNALNGSFIPAN
jgi:hypothetical protein